MPLALPLQSTVINTLSGAVIGVQTMCDYIKTQLVSAGWTATFFAKASDFVNENSVNYTAGDTVTVAGQTYTFRAALAAPNDVKIGTTATVSMQNLMNAINGGPGSGTAYFAGTVANVSAKAGPVWLTPQLTLTVQTRSLLEWAAPVLTVSKTTADANTYWVNGNMACAGWMLDSAVDADSGNQLRMYVLDGDETAFIVQARISIGNPQMTVRSNGLPRAANPFSSFYGTRLLANSANPWRMTAHQFGGCFIWDGVAAAATNTNFIGFGCLQVDPALLPATITAVQNNGGFVQIQISADVGWSTTDLIVIRGNTGWTVGDNINVQTTVTRNSATLYTTTLPYIGPYTQNGRAGGVSTVSQIGQVAEAGFLTTGNGTETWLRALLSGQNGGVTTNLINGYAYGPQGGVGIWTFNLGLPALKSSNNPLLSYGGSAITLEPNMMANNTVVGAARYVGKAYGMFLTGQSTLLGAAGVFQALNWVNFTDSNAGNGSNAQGSVYLLLP